MQIAHRSQHGGFGASKHYVRNIRHFLRNLALIDLYCRMPWQGNASVLIDRFDVRAHLDFIPEVQSSETTYPEEAKECRPLNYERYRILVQNNFLKIKEEKFLKTIAMEEKYGGKTYQQQKAEDDKKKIEKSKAAIGFTYEDSTGPTNKGNPVVNDEQQHSDSDEDFDLDTVVNFSALNRDQQHELNSFGKSYFLGRDDFTRFLKQEAAEQDAVKSAKIEEEEKSAFSGRKSRKERRIMKERKLAGRVPSPPSYATYNEDNKSRWEDSSSESSSRSPSPDVPVSGKVEYITTFGEDTTAKKKDRRSGSSSKRKPTRKRSSSTSSSSDDGR